MNQDPGTKNAGPGAKPSGGRTPRIRFSTKLAAILATATMTIVALPILMPNTEAGSPSDVEWIMVGEGTLSSPCESETESTNIAVVKSVSAGYIIQVGTLPTTGFLASFSALMPGVASPGEAFWIACDGTRSLQPLISAIVSKVECVAGAGELDMQAVALDGTTVFLDGLPSSCLVTPPNPPINFGQCDKSKGWGLMPPDYPAVAMVGGNVAPSDPELCRILKAVFAPDDCIENGDCVCGKQKSPTDLIYPDTDQDGVPDDSSPLGPADIDDDCDFYTDPLEELLDTLPKLPNNIFDMRPLDNLGIAVKVSVKRFWSNGGDIEGGGTDKGDPFALNPKINTVASGLDVSDPNLEAFLFPKFNKADHPSNTDDHTFALPAGSDWYETAYNSDLRSSKFNDRRIASGWKFRDASTGTDALKTQIPNVEILVPIWDDDPGDRAPDDSYGNVIRFTKNLYDLANKVGSAFNPYNWPGGGNGGTFNPQVELQLSAAVCPSALEWAQAAALGDTEVLVADLTTIPGYHEC